MYRKLKRGVFSMSKCFTLLLVAKYLSQLYIDLKFQNVESANEFKSNIHTVNKRLNISVPSIQEKYSNKISKEDLEPEEDAIEFK